MTSIELRIGHLATEGFQIQRSGFRWLKEDGQDCRPGEMIAYCNIGLNQTGTSLANKAHPFNSETPDLQVGFATKIGGKLRHARDSSHGGFHDFREDYHRWQPEFVIGHIEPDAVNKSEPEGDPQTLRAFFYAGRRTTPLADVRNGLLCGWHSRSRVWSGEGPAPRSTLLSLGICEQSGVIRGERSAFLELLEDIDGPAHLIYFPENPLVPSACILLEQINRSSTHCDEIATDLARTWHRLGLVPTPHDWLFAGSLLANLQQTPIGEDYEILTRFGLSQIGPANAILLSVNSESSVILRHKRLGYSLNCHPYRIREAGPAVRTWLQTAFDRIKRTPKMIQEDLRDLILAVRKNHAAEFLIMNCMSTSGFEDVFNYSLFDRPLGDVLGTYNAKEMNLMLHDLSHECDISIVDTDAIAADIGAEEHLPDGVHQSGALQAETRKEILHILTKRNVPGFSVASR
jgi:hypothetical protein